MCATYTCDTLAENTCTLKNITAVPNSFKLQKCDDASFCPYNPLDSADSCSPRPATTYYPGSACKSSQDCVFGVDLPCEAGMCTGKFGNQNCTAPTECMIGLTCRLSANATEEDPFKTCQSQLGAGGECVNELDCMNNMGCHEKKCTAYFSLADDTEVATQNARVCSSGYALDGQCKTLMLQNATSTCENDDSCVYTDMSLNSTVTLQNACSCGYNRVSEKYCAVGSANEEYTNYVQNAKKLLNDTSRCHTVERNGVCAENVGLNRSVNFRRNVQNFGNSKVMAFNAHKLRNADSCAKFIPFSAYSEAVIKPDTYQCAKFTCATKNENSTCLSSYNPYAEAGAGVQVNLTSGVCNHKNETCSAGPLGINQVYNDQHVTGSCVASSPPTPTSARYPGEDCENDDQCITTTGFTSTCLNETNRCSGVEEFGNCTSNVMCDQGLSCNTTHCVHQLKAGDACDDTYDCGNQFACYNKTCTEFGTLKTGANMTKLELGDFYLSPMKALLCEFENIGENDKCTQIAYAGETANNTNTDGYVKCNWGSKCSYTDGNKEMTQDCGCGYNADGQGYCPIAQNISKCFGIYYLVIILTFINFYKIILIILTY